MIYDVVVVGGGIAGLYAALVAKKNGANVANVVKNNIFVSNSSVASGGINAVLKHTPNDSITKHVNDTIKGATGLSDTLSIKAMCQEAPYIIEELHAMGVAFDTNEEGQIAQRPFGGASANRTCYKADKTGAAIVQGLIKACQKEGIEILQQHMVLDIATFEGKLSGITVLRRKDSHVIALACKALVLAGGGFAGAYRNHTTNSAQSSGDVIALALRAKMRLSNMEFVQFHPTTLKTTGALISEAARGEGAYIVDETGERFTDELQTRDKLSQALARHMQQGHEVFLDFRHLDEELIATRLPSTQSLALNSAGIDITKELLPIAPAAHYTMGGIWTRYDTSTSLDGVFACGECAVSGVHGANRLGGNSLLEAAHFGRVAGKNAAHYAQKHTFLPIDYAFVEKNMRQIKLIIEGESLFNVNAMRQNLGENLFKNAGIFRTEYALSSALEYVHYLVRRQYGLHCIDKSLDNNVELVAILEFLNALKASQAMILSALKRQESRGAHYREDFEARNDKDFLRPSILHVMRDDLYKVNFSHHTWQQWWYKVLKKLKP